MAAISSSCLIRNVPQRLLEHVIFHCWANLSRSMKLLVVITEDHLYEVHNKEILSSIPLHTSGKLNGSSIINGGCFIGTQDLLHLLI